MTHMDLVACIEKAPRHEETVPRRKFRTIPGGKGADQAIPAARADAIEAAAAAALSMGRPGASASMPYRSEIEAQHTS